jgi:peptidoglycan/LPS O-acetylase OafA/YrhL
VPDLRLRRRGLEGCSETPDAATLKTSAREAVNPIRSLSHSAHVPALDGLRGLAILAVLLHHTTGNLGAPGWLGVTLFFALSGYLITGILLDTKGAPGYFSSFYARRTLRIFPLYYATLALLAVIGAPVAWSDWAYLSNVQLARSGWPAAPTPTAHLWSLAIEEQFYLVWPFVVLLLSRARLRTLALGLVVGSLALRALVLAVGGTHASVAAYVLTPMRADALAVGAWLAAAVRGRPSMRAAVHRHAGEVALWAAVAVGICVLVPPFASAYTVAMQTVGYTAASVGSAALLALAIHDHPAMRWASWGWLRTLGLYSYGLYVLHYPIALAVESLGAGRFAAPLTLTLSGLAAFASYHLLEQPARRLKRYVPRPPPVHSLGPQATASACL